MNVPKNISVDVGRGVEVEKTRPLDTYFSDSYFTMQQLGSFAHQLNQIWLMRPKNVLEIGVGNGFVSTFLRRAGIPVTTVDINPLLGADICAPLSELGKHLDGKFDLVVCCEVLEHMPLSELEHNLDIIRDAGHRLFLTLPNANRTIGFGGLIPIPKVGVRIVDFNVDVPYKHKLEGGPHFWEVGYSRECSRAAIVKSLRTRYACVKSGRFALNPYHIYFECI